MFLTHFAVALIAKCISFEIPLTIFVFASLLPNLLRACFVLIGIETMQISHLPLSKAGLDPLAHHDTLEGFARFSMRARFSHSVYVSLLLGLMAFLVPFFLVIILRAVKQFAPCKLHHHDCILLNDAYNATSH